MQNLSSLATLFAIYLFLFCTCTYSGCCLVGVVFFFLIICGCWCCLITEMLKTILGECQGDLLLKYTDSEDGLTPLSYAAFKGYVDIVSYLLKDFPKSISYLNKDKSSPFHKASLGGHVEVLKALYSIPEGRKYLLVVDSRYQTVLHLAAKEGHDIAVKFLLNNCLDLNKGRELLNKKDIHNQTPLSLATTKKVQDFIKSYMLH